MEEALQAIRKGLEELQVNFYLIGAVALDLYLRQIYNQKVNRPTLDIDVAVLVSDEEEYNQLKQHLVSAHGFTERSTNAFALVHANGTTVDLMPFGEIADASNWVKVRGVGMTSISVPGIAEAYETAGEMQTEEGDIWRVCTPMPST